MFTFVLFRVFLNPLRLPVWVFEPKKKSEKKSFFKNKINQKYVIFLEEVLMLLIYVNILSRQGHPLINKIFEMEKNWFPYFRKYGNS